MDNSVDNSVDNSCTRHAPADNGGHPAPPFMVTQHPPFGANGGCWVVRMGGAQHPPEENIYLELRATEKRTIQRKSLPKVRARALPSLWITR